MDGEEETKRGRIEGGWGIERGEVIGGEGRRYHFTTKRAFTDRCTYVHQHEAPRGKKVCPGIIHYDSSFRNNNEAYAAPRPPRHESYVWKRETRKSSLSLPLANPDHLDFHPVMYRVRRGRRTCDESRFANFSWIVVTCRIAIDDSSNEFHQPVFTG